MTLALFQSGWHWPLVAVAVVAILAIVCAIAVGQSDSDWLGAHRRELRRVAWGAVFLVVIALLAGQLHRLGGMLKRVQDGDPSWLALGVAIESLSFVGYIALTYEMFRKEAPRLNLAACVEITFGGVVATRLFSAGGAGGIAFTTWALRAAGMSTRRAAQSIAVFLAIMYAPFVAACGLGWLGGGVPDAVMWVGVAIGIGGFGGAALLTLIPGDLERRARKLACGHGRMARLAAKLASVPAVAGEATRAALTLIRRRPSLLGWSVLWWAADVAVLDACFRAFGEAPALGVLIMGYFLGHIGNLLPMPGGVGGVEGGMVGVFVACGMPLDVAVVGTIAYQVISTWLPVAPGLAAYWSLRRRVARWRSDAPDDDELQEAAFAGARRPAAARR